MAQLMFKIANEPQPDIRSINPAVPAALAAVIDKVLTKDPDQRYQTGTELAHDLRQSMAGVHEQGAEGDSDQVDLSI